MKKTMAYVVFVVLFLIGIIQITNSALAFYNVKKNVFIYEKYLLDVKDKYQNHDFEEKIANKVIELTTFLKSYDSVYYFAFLYSIMLIGISLLSFKFIDRARIALIYYSVISLFYTPFITILREINGNRMIYLYQDINKLMTEHSQNKYVMFQNMINNWYQFQGERFAANICIVSVLTIFYLFVIYFFSTNGPKISGKISKIAGHSPNKHTFMF